MQTLHNKEAHSVRGDELDGAALEACRQAEAAQRRLQCVRKRCPPWPLQWSLWQLYLHAHTITHVHDSEQLMRVEP